MVLGLLPVGEATQWRVEQNSTGNVYKLGLLSTITPNDWILRENVNLIR